MGYGREGRGMHVVWQQTRTAVCLAHCVNHAYRPKTAGSHGCHTLIHTRLHSKVKNGYDDVFLSPLTANCFSSPPLDGSLDLSFLNTRPAATAAATKIQATPLPLLLGSSAAGGCSRGTAMETCVSSAVLLLVVDVLACAASAGCMFLFAARQTCLRRDLLTCTTC